MSIKALNHNVMFKSAFMLPLIQREQFTYMKHLYKVLYHYFCVTNIQIITEVLE